MKAKLSKTMNLNVTNASGDASGGIDGEGVNGLEVQYRIEDGVLATNLDGAYGIHVDGVRFIPMGDSAYSYRVDCTNGERYYLKLFDHRNDRQRRSIERLPAYLPLTWQMYHQGLLRNITYPVKNQQGGFITTFHDITVVMFNFIEGETLADAYPFSNEVVASIAEAAAAIHRITPAIDKTVLSTETFDISFASDLEQCLSRLENTAACDDPIKQALRAHVLPNKEQVYALLELLRKLRGVAEADTREHVVCHGDLWGGNLIRLGRELHVLDWESAILAPPEYDFVGYIGEEFEVFHAAYEKRIGHAVTVNADLLRFYAYRHHLRNLTNWLMNMLYRNTEDAQNENDLDMIINHCMNRWDRIEPQVRAVEDRFQKREP